MSVAISTLLNISTDLEAISVAISQDFAGALRFQIASIWASKSLRLVNLDGRNRAVQ